MLTDEQIATRATKEITRLGNELFGLSEEKAFRNGAKWARWQIAASWTEPTREQIAQAIHDSIQREAPGEYVGPCYDTADAVLALFAKETA